MGGLRVRALRVRRRGRGSTRSSSPRALDSFLHTKIRNSVHAYTRASWRHRETRPGGRGAEEAVGKDDAIIYAGPTCDARERRSGEYPWPCPAAR